MARRNYTHRRVKATIAEPQYACRDCANSYDWHEIGFNGKPFMCRCPHYTNGRFCRFLDDTQCEHFVKRIDKQCHE